MASKRGERRRAERHTSDYQRRACAGKVQHWSRWRAEAEARRLERRGDGATKVYQCGACGAFHVGHLETRLVRTLRQIAASVSPG